VKPFLQTRQAKADGAAARWFKQYWRKEGMPADKGIIYHALLKLGASPSPDAVDEAIGNTSWTGIDCDACGKRVERAVMVGQEPDYESCTATICGDCLAEAAALISTSAQCTCSTDAINQCPACRAARDRGKDSGQ
jgi:hypothetical protein